MATKTYTLHSACMTLGTARAMLAEPGNYSADQLARARAVAAHWARVRRAQGARKATAKTASPERSATMALDIPLHLRGCRLRVTEAQANVGTHAWDVSTPGAWDANSDAAAYCLDAIDAIPAGSTRELSRGPGPRCILREPYPCDEVRDSKAAP